VLLPGSTAEDLPALLRPLRPLAVDPVTCAGIAQLLDRIPGYALEGSAPAGDVDPAQVHALIVGVERYDAGTPWDLPGPARDAVRFYRLLREAGVPEAQLRLHLAPSPPYVPDVRYEPADQATLRRVLIRELPLAPGGTLWVWWGGHGVLDRADRLRLLCSDATAADKLGIDLDSVVERYASDAVPALGEQLWIVDACGTSAENDLPFRQQLPPYALPVGRRTLAHRQTVLRAAGRGRAAAHEPGTGFFSDVVLGLLADRAATLPALPDPEELFPAVQARIAALGEAGHTLQYPVIQLRSPERTEVLSVASPATPLAPERPPAVPLRRAVEALLAYPAMADPTERQSVVAALSPRVTATLPRHTKTRTDVVSILTSLAQRHPEALMELFDAVVSVDDHPGRRHELEAALRALHEDEGVARHGATSRTSRGLKSGGQSYLFQCGIRQPSARVLRAAPRPLPAQRDVIRPSLRRDGRTGREKRVTGRRRSAAPSRRHSDTTAV
jgi:hypothetical protein